MITVTIMKKKTRLGIFKNIGENIPGGNFPGGNSPGGCLMGGNFPGRSFPDTVFFALTFFKSNLLTFRFSLSLI